MVFFERAVNPEGAPKKDTLLLKTTTFIEEYESRPAPRETREFWIKYLVQDQLDRMNHIDSIGIYSISDHKLQAMIYSPKIEKDKGLKSSTKYPNPFSKTSWVLDFKDGEYNKNKWGVNISNVTYTLKRLEP
ncbi:hypothetical protein [Porphyromonas sp.]|uniref:hypothetical protein n=1 Tax=Porphyromonas sp. TaxID=1924944 RepID=UPI0026DBA3C0|nr:hypothetical protein [Porphyromonas sp.]MDO4770421.1 hypothetical protein [Porphyromonas sp.]